jgi:hypothetical protein
MDEVRLRRWRKQAFLILVFLHWSMAFLFDTVASERPLSARIDPTDCGRWTDERSV